MKYGTRKQLSTCYTRWAHHEIHVSLALCLCVAVSYVTWQPVSTPNQYSWQTPVDRKMQECCWVITAKQKHCSLLPPAQASSLKHTFLNPYMTGVACHIIVQELENAARRASIMLADAEARGADALAAARAEHEAALARHLSFMVRAGVCFSRFCKHHCGARKALSGSICWPAVASSYTGSRF